MSLVHYTACAEQVSSEAAACPKCGHPNAENRITQGSKKSRVTAGVFALLLGGIGIHKFYLDKVGLGLVYILFCWTFIPLIIGAIEGIIYLVQDDVTFSQKQGVAV
jgi:TM2 domain-containing membrane protein YozV